MLVTINLFEEVSGRSANDNMVSALRGLQSSGDGAQLYKPHRLAMFIAQTAHESMGWKHDREIWGPTKAQLSYEGRANLGNTQKGDGSKFRGYTPMQITGRYNTTKFYNWCVKIYGSDKVPKFIDNPSLMNTDPWEGIGPIWYWVEGTSTNLNLYADRGDFKEVTRRINGGYTNISDRYRYYGRVALYLLGKNVNSIAAYQKEKGMLTDGIVGEKTAAALHKDLLQLPFVQFNRDQITESKSTFSLLNFIQSLLSIFKGK